MPYDLTTGSEASRLGLAAAKDAASCDTEGGFPQAALTALHQMGATSPSVANDGVEDLLWMLAAVGRGDLSVGRILEGHINVVLLLDLFGTREQQARARKLIERGDLLGVWNTDAPGNPLRLEGDRLIGAKGFATGVDGLAEAVVTVETEAGRQMLLVPLAGLPVDRSWWRPLGMRASGSHIVDFTGVTITDGMRLGRPGDYVRQPWFSGGAIRFCAVHVGGMHGLLDLCVEHLTRIGRAGDPYQRHRLADMAVAVETGYGWLRRAADSWARLSNERPNASAEAETVAVVNAARGAIERAAMDTLELAERSVGAGGLIAPHPLERRIRDLRTYLRQPNPDGAQAAAGQAVAEGVWTPGDRGPRHGAGA